MSEQTPQSFEFGPFRLDGAERTLWKGQERITLTPKAFDTLAVLVEHSGRLLEKDELMKAVWPDSFVEEGNLTNNIWTLRKALSDSDFIETVPKRGYRFNANVRRAPAVTEAVVLERHTRATVVTYEEEGELQPESGRLLLPAARPAAGRKVLVSIAMLLLVSLIGVAIWLTVRRQPSVRDIPFGQFSISRVTSSGKVKHAAISPDGKYVAHISTNAQGDSLSISNVTAPKNVLIAGPSATEFVSVTFAPDGNSLYYLTLDRNKGHTALYRVPVLGGASSLAVDDVGPIGFSPDGKEIAFVKYDHDKTHLFIANVDGTNEQSLTTLKQPALFRIDWNAPNWSPDGKAIACQARLSDERGTFETVVGVNRVDGSIRNLSSERWAYTEQAVWLNDGRGLMVTASVSETSPTQVWQVDAVSGRTTQITHDLNDYSNLSLTADSKSLVAVQYQSVSSIWTSNEGSTDRPKQINSEVGLIDGLAWFPDGRIVYQSTASGNPELWVMNADGSNPKQLTVDARANRGLAVSPDGRYIFFASDRSGRFHIWRVDSDGKNLKQVTNTDGEFYPEVTPDSAAVIYQRGEIEGRLWKVSVNGEDPLQLSDARALHPSVSPKGDLIAYHYLDSDVDSWRIGVTSATGGPRWKQFDLPAVTPNHRLIRWTPDGNPSYPNGARGLAEIWVQPLDGSQPKQLTDLKAEQIVCFEWSRDRHVLAVIQKVQTSDTVLITNTSASR